MKRTNTGERKGRTEVSRLKVMTQCPIILFTQETRVSSDNLRKMSAVECTVVVVGGAGLVAKSNPTFVTPWTVAHQAPLSMGFHRQEYWSGLPRPPPGNLSQGIFPQGWNLCLLHLLHLQVRSLPLVPLWVSPLQGEIYVLHLPRQKNCKMITLWTKTTISLQFGFNL